MTVIYGKLYFEKKVKQRKNNNYGIMKCQKKFNHNALPKSKHEM